MAVEREELLKFLSKHVRKRKEFKAITDDTALFTTGVIDSFAMADLLTFLEKKTGKRYDFASLPPESLDSIRAIIELTAK